MIQHLLRDFCNTNGKQEYSWKTNNKTLALSPASSVYLEGVTDAHLRVGEAEFSTPKDDFGNIDYFQDMKDSGKTLDLLPNCLREVS